MWSDRSQRLLRQVDIIPIGLDVENSERSGAPGGFRVEFIKGCAQHESERFQKSFPLYDVIVGTRAE